MGGKRKKTRKGNKRRREGGVREKGRMERRKTKTPRDKREGS